jgi:signal transduction histidine kinase/CheY-like chemotaxis protein
VLRIVPPERHGEEAELLRLVAAGEHVTQREVDRVRRDGTRVPVALTLSPIRDATGAVVAVSSIIRNVAERRRLEGELRQAQKMEAIGRLAGGIAHDFNNLLTAIRGNADLLLGELAPDTQARADVDEIRRAADRAAGLTRQLLAFSRKQVLQPRVLDVDEVVAGVDRLLCRVIGEDVRLRTLLRAGAGRVLADPGQLEQVLLNLAVNARDAMPGGGTLTIGTRLVPAPALPAPAATLRAPHGVVVITVADTGVGMDDATRARAFEPFFTTKDAGKGTGLGLATVFGIAQQSGGTVWLESEPGRGTTVSLALPVTAAARRAHTPAPGVPVVPGARGTVLLVEDEPAVRALVGRVLTGAGYRVLPAGDGRTAHAVWREHDGAAGGIDVVVSDLIMPERGGRELVALLREEHPALPVLFTSGYAEGGITAADLGARTAFLEKPFAAERMLGALAELLDARVSGPPARGR